MSLALLVSLSWARRYPSRLATRSSEFMRVALLTNFIPPYRAPLYREIERRCSDFRLFLSAPTEAGRTWNSDWGQLPVQMQRSIASRWTWRHPRRFSERMTMHFPYDTVPLLMRFRPDVVFAGEMGFRNAAGVDIPQAIPGKRVSHLGEGSDATEQGRGRLRHWLRTSLLGITDAVVVNGESGANYISAFGVSRDRIFPVPATTDLAPFLSLPVTRPRELRHRLLYSGMLTERKNLLALLGHLADWAMQNPARQIESHLPRRRSLAAGHCSLQPAAESCLTSVGYGHLRPASERLRRRRNPGFSDTGG